MSNNHAKEPVVYVRRRIRTQPIGDVVANVVASANQQEFSSREIGQTSPKPQQPNKLLENKEAKTIKKGRTNYSSNTSNLNTISSKGGGAGNAKVISDDKEEKHKTCWNPQTQEETHLNQLALVYDGNNIDYVTSQLDFVKDLGEAADTRVCSLSKSLNDNISIGSYNNAKRKGKEIYQERNNKMDFADFYAQRRNKGITICEKSENSRPGEMAKLLGTSNNNHSTSGQILQFQDMNQLSPNYLLNNGMKEMRVWPRVHHKPRAIVHPSKVIGPSRFSQYYDQYMQRTTSVSAPVNFSLMKLLMGDENSSTLTDEELMYAKELLTTQDLSSGGQRVQLQPCSQVRNYQDVQGTSNFSYMRLLMEDEDSSILSEELNENQFLSTRYSLSSEGQRVQQHWPGSQVGNYQFENSVQQINLQGCQNQVLQKISYMDLLTRDDISYMDLLTREDISWT